METTQGAAEPAAVSEGLDTREPAPANSLPTWSECSLRVENSDFIAKRVAEGGYGAEPDTLLASELHRFIYEYDDADPYTSSWFMHRLELVMEEAKRASAPVPPVAAVQDDKVPAKEALIALSRYFKLENEMWEGPDGCGTSGTALCKQIADLLGLLSETPLALGLKNIAPFPFAARAAQSAPVPPNVQVPDIVPWDMRPFVRGKFSDDYKMEELSEYRAFIAQLKGQK